MHMVPRPVGAEVVRDHNAELCGSGFCPWWLPTKPSAPVTSKDPLAGASRPSLTTPRCWSRQASSSANDAADGCGGGWTATDWPRSGRPSEGEPAERLLKGTSGAAVIAAPEHESDRCHRRTRHRYR